MNKKDKMVLVLSAEDAVKHIPDQATLVCDGFIIANSADELFYAIEKRFLSTGHPKGLSLIHAAGLSNNLGLGMDRLAHEGLLRRSTGGHWKLMTGIRKLAYNNKIEAYNFPQGVITHMIRDAVSKRPGTITRTGLFTFVDPRIEGGKVNAITKEDWVELIHIDDKEYLLFKPFKIDVAILRGTKADMHGNISIEEESLICSGLSCAQAAHNNGGLVLAQVKEVVKDGLLPPRSIAIPGIFVDIVCPVSNLKYHKQVDTVVYDPSLCGLGKADLKQEPPMPMSERKIISRRGLMEMRKGDIANLGIGMPEGVAAVASEQGILNNFTFSIEAGPIGGLPLSGMDFGSAKNFEAVLDAGAQFDFYQGGGLDIAILGLAQADTVGNVNVSKFNGVIAGCGGFIDITQNAKRVVFLGTFTAQGLKVSCENGEIKILQEGTLKKFVKDVEQITFSGRFAAQKGQEAIFVTERAVFKICNEGLELIEIAPGVDLQRDILDQMDFMPIVRDLKMMPHEIFVP